MISIRDGLAATVFALSTACGGSTAATPEPPSCAPGGPGMTDCGAASESCCTSLEVTGGTVVVSPVVAAGTVSDFRLDKYDVTVGRFRQFVKAWTNGYVPPPGAGKHVDLHAGNGLANSGGDGGTSYEPGWLASDDANLNPTDAALACNGFGIVLPPGSGEFFTWTPSPANQETLPINCVNWWEAYAFCIWDGGYLPSLNEGIYAATGGDEGREFAWGSRGRRFESSRPD